MATPVPVTQTSVNSYKCFVRSLFGLPANEKLAPEYEAVINKIKDYSKVFKNFEIEVFVETKLKNHTKNEEGKKVIKVDKKVNKYNIWELVEKGKRFPQNTKSIKFTLRPACYDEKTRTYYQIPKLKAIDEFSIDIGKETGKARGSKMKFGMQEIQNFSDMISFVGLKTEEDLVC